MQGWERENRDALRRGPPAAPPDVPFCPLPAIPPGSAPTAPLALPPGLSAHSSGNAALQSAAIVAPEAPPPLPPPVPLAPPVAAPPLVPPMPPVLPLAPPLAPQPVVAPARVRRRKASDTDSSEASAEGGWGDCFVAGALSAAVHLVVFIVLALHVVASRAPFRQELVLNVTSHLEEGAVGEQDYLAPTTAVNLDVSSVYSSFVGDAMIPVPSGAERVVIDDEPPPREDLHAPPQHLDREARKTDRGLRNGGERRLQPRMAESASTQQALDGVLGEIGARASKQDLLVVWMFDASVSLRDDRPQIAARLAGFFRQQDALPEKEKHLVMSAAVAFGSMAVELEPPTRVGKKIVDAVGRVPDDTTGMERTFAAVKWVAQRYPKHRGQMMIVVWTDEAGDDLQELEAAIQVCNKRKVLVSVVGPSAVLGRIYGRQSWPNPAGGRPLGLQVTRGPDSPAPERLLLPYWFETRFPSWGEWGEGSIDQFPAWYGGPQLEFLLSGLGPYGLVRLVTATGGTYTLLDRAADRSPFRLEVMRPYLPSCQSAKEYADEVRHYPLRQAIVNAADATLGERNWPPPRLEFTAPQPAALRDMFVSAQAQARRAVQVISRALSFFGRDGMEKLYAQEKSPRWQAWYDLTRGRLLASLVRYGQYELLCAGFQQQGSLRSTTNHVLLVPAAAFRGDASVQATAAEAERLLRRCLGKNPNTPWAYLAQRELDYPPGLDFEQSIRPQEPPNKPPKGGTARANPAAKTFIPPRL